MIREIITELKKDEHYGVSREVDIAKGMYKYETSFRKGLSKIRRVWQSKG